MSDSGIITLSNLEEFRSHTLQLAQQAQRQITIFTRDLELELYNNALFVDAVLNLLKKSRRTEVRILAMETKHLPEMGHQVLKLFRYADEQFQLKKTGIDPAINTSSYFICDDHSIIRRQRADSYQGLCYTGDRARVMEQMEDFYQLWNTASTDPNLRQLTL